jgi:hypothetical protein
MKYINVSDNISIEELKEKVVERNEKVKEIV